MPWNVDAGRDQINTRVSETKQRGGTDRQVFIVGMNQGCHVLDFPSPLRGFNLPKRDDLILFRY